MMMNANCRFQSDPDFMLINSYVKHGMRQLIVVISSIEQSLLSYASLMVRTDTYVKVRV